jgi:hypothetical protein
MEKDGSENQNNEPNDSVPDKEEEQRVEAVASKRRAYEQMMLDRKKVERKIALSALLFICVAGVVAWAFMKDPSSSIDNLAINCLIGKTKNSKLCEDVDVERRSDWKAIGKNRGGNSQAFSLQ